MSANTVKLIKLSKFPTISLEYEIIPCATTSRGQLLFLHGAGSNHHYYEKAYRYFSKNFDVYVFSCPGFAQSSTPPKYNVDLLTEIYLEFAREIHLHNYILVGHSFGGAMAAQMALRSKDIKLLVLVSPLLFKLQGYLQQVVYRISRQVLSTARFEDAPAVSNAFGQGLWQNIKQVINSIRLYFLLKKHDFGKEVSQLSIPTVGIVGLSDSILQPQLQLDNLKCIPNIQIFEIPDGSHHVIFTDRAQILNIILHHVNSYN